MKRKYSNDRPEFLSALIKEFYTTKSLEAKKEILANLSNFSYNPINYGYLRHLGVVDVFLDCLNNSDVDLIRFSMAGLCNLSADPENKTIIYRKGGIAQISKFLGDSNAEVVLPALTSLIYLVGPSTVASITTSQNIVSVSKLKNSEDKRLNNLATIFLEDICSQELAASGFSEKASDNAVWKFAKLMRKTLLLRRRSADRDS